MALLRVALRHGAAGCPGGGSRSIPYIQYGGLAVVAESCRCLSLNQSDGLYGNCPVFRDGRTDGSRSGQFITAGWGTTELDGPALSGSSRTFSKEAAMRQITPSSIAALLISTSILLAGCGSQNDIST